MQKAKEAKIAAWDRKPWPMSGDADESKLYAAVGRALSAWERYEARLAFLFAQFMNTPTLQPPIRAYCAIRTFEGRASMLQAASLAFFYGLGIPDDHQLVKDFKSVLSQAKKFSERRNDIAHGVVDHYHPQTNDTGAWINRSGYALFPTYGSLKERDQAGIPTYCYSSAELDYFSEQFRALQKPAHTLAAEISVTTDALMKALNTPVNALPRKPLQPSHT